MAALLLTAGVLLGGVSVAWLWRHPGLGRVALWAMPVFGLLAVVAVLGWLWHRRSLRRLLREADQRCDRILQGTQDGWWEFDLARGQAFLSERWRHMHGVSARDMAPQDWRTLLHPDDRDRMLAELGARQRDPACLFHEMEYRCLLADGRTIWVRARGLFERGPDGRARRISGSASDITARKEQELALQDALHQTQAILDHMVDGVIVIDARGTVAAFNQAAVRIFGYEASEVLGRNVSMLMPEPHRGHHDNYLRQHQATGEKRVIGVGRDVEGLRKDGSTFPMHLSVSRTQQHGQPVFIGLAQDTTQRRRAEEEIHRLAFYDPLTGLPNRRLLTDRLQHALAGSARSGHHGAVMLLDLDNFKLINDTQGHDIGDLLLRQVAQRLSAAVREADTVARLGGDEFVLLLEALGARASEAASQAETIALKILRSLGQPYQLGELQHRSTPSIGVVLFQSDTVRMDELLKMADVAMYQAKAAGRNTTRFYDPAMQAEVAARTALEADLRLSLGQDFLLHYQPQVDRHGHTVGFEALLRWQHPQRGNISPGAFIPLAEETGLIGPLGSWVLQAACAQLVRWAAQPAMAHCTVAVNVSARQLGAPDFVDLVLDLLVRSGAQPQRLKLELTESMLAVDVESVIGKMVALKQRGVGFSLDDFGTGYSSLSYLKRLPLDQLKIDQSFVRDLLVNANAAVIARTIIGLGHSLALSVIAEGVETEAQQAMLWNSGCDAFQGYLLGRPVPAEAAEARLRAADTQT